MSVFDSLDAGAPFPLFLSSHPLEAEPEGRDPDAALAKFIEAIRERGIATVMPLLLPDESIGGIGLDRLCEAYREAGLDVAPYPLLNHGTPGSLEEFHGRMQDLRGRLERGGVLTHCRSGCGRTALVASGVLICAGEGAPEAIDRVCRIRPRALPSLTQIQFLRSYYRYLHDRDQRAIP